eukprot:scaffold161396_cov30-Tisochrysis_lutea.AAC.8
MAAEVSDGGENQQGVRDSLPASRQVGGRRVELLQIGARGARRAKLHRKSHRSMARSDREPAVSRHWSTSMSEVRAQTHR